MTIDEKTYTLLNKARIDLILNQPFFGSLACRLDFVESNAIPTLAVNNKKMLYNPKFVNSLTTNLRKSAVAHEVLHVVLEHLGRLKDRDPRRWNLACDFAVNALLKSSGFELGHDWLYNPQWVDMSAEVIYPMLKNDNSQKHQPDGGANGLDSIMSPEGADDPDAERKLKEEAFDWRNAAIQAAQAARMQGRLPGSLERFIEEIAGGRIDWRSVLWRFAKEVAKLDYSWARPMRKYVPYGYHLPSLYSEGMGTMVVIIDVSGSIMPPVLNAFVSETRSVREAVKPVETYVIYADDGVQHVDRFEAEDELTMKVIGGGGTDFRPPFYWLEERNINPACCLYITDMEGVFPDEAPDFPVLWIATTRHIAPWGETVRITL